MDVQRWHQVQELFHAVVALEPAQREDFLKSNETTNGEAALLVRNLLVQDANLLPEWDDQLTSVTSNGGEEQPLPPDVGPYRFLERLGEGGMGVVFRAVHLATGQIVAIKVLASAALSVASRERFATEQRALARLDHPLIARLYGSERLPDGTPCFVMEYVEGETLTAYCSHHPCSIPQRLTLFRQVCEAVRYAHEHAIIHRDLKPSNILVKSDGTVRLLDFGTAKQLDVSDQGYEITNLHPTPMTLGYASPEQVSGGLAGTQTDVYALGLILYELLSERPPLNLKRQTLGEAEHIIRFRTPEKPSRFIADADRGGNPFRFFARTDWDDLDLICMTAIQKEPERRYRSVEMLMRDLEHWANKQPLDVRGDSIPYLLTKFARRHVRALLVGASLLAILSTASVLIAVNITKARNQARREQGRTQRIENFLLSLFELGGGFAGPKRSATALDMLDYGTKELPALQSDRDIQADLQLVLGKLYKALGQYKKANQLLNAALQAEPVFPDTANSPVSLDALISLGLLRRDESDYAEGERLEGRALQQLDRDPKSSPVLLARAEAALGNILVAARDFNAATPHLQAALQIQTKLGDEDSRAATLTDLAGAQQEAGDYAAAIASTQGALQSDRRLYGDRHPRVGDAWESLGQINQMRQRYKDAADNYKQAIRIYRSWYGEEHPSTIEALLCLGQAQLSEKQYGLARESLQKGLALNEKLLGDKNNLMIFGLNVLASLEQRTGHFDAAQNDFERLISTAGATYGPGNYMVAFGLSNLATLNRERGRYREAEKQYREVLKKLAPLHMTQIPEGAKVQLNLGKTLAKEKRYAEAAQSVRSAIQIFEKVLGGPAQDLTDARATLTAIEKQRSN